MVGLYRNSRLVDGHSNDTLEVCPDASRRDNAEVCAVAEETFIGYVRNIRKTFNKETREWPREHAWEVGIIIALPLAALGLYGVEIDYKLLWTTLVTYAATFLIYCVVQFCRAPWKLQQQENQRATSIIAAVERERDDALAKLRTGKVSTKPFVAPHEYGRSEKSAAFGLTITNAGYVAFDIHIPPVPVRPSMYVLKFPEMVTQLGERDHKRFIEAWLEYPALPQRSGADLQEIMRAHNVESLPFAIVYKDSSETPLWYKSNCVIIRDVPGKRHGLRVRYLSQEPIPRTGDDVNDK